MLEIDHMINYIPALQTLVDEENMSKTVGTQVGTQDLTDPTTPSLTNTGTPSGGEKQNIQRQRRSEENGSDTTTNQLEAYFSNSCHKQQSVKCVTRKW